MNNNIVLFVSSPHTTCPNEFVFFLHDWVSSISRKQPAIPRVIRGEDPRKAIRYVGWLDVRTNVSLQPYW